MRARTLMMTWRISWTELGLAGWWAWGLPRRVLVFVPGLLVPELHTAPPELLPMRGPSMLVPYYGIIIALHRRTVVGAS